MSRTTPASSRPVTGSGRAGGRRSAGKRSADGKAGVKRALLGIGRKSLKKLARRGGVVRIADGCFDVDKGMPAALQHYLSEVMRRIVPIVEHSRRWTVITNDVAYALKQMGTTLYKQGADWTYGFYSRSYVRRRITRPLDHAALAAAATSRAQSEATLVQRGAGAGAGHAADMEVEMEAGAAAVQEQRQLAPLFEAEAQVLAAEQSQGEEEQPGSVVSSAVRPAERLQPGEQEAQQEDAAVGGVQQERQQQGEPLEEQDGVAAAASRGQPVSSPAERRLSGVPTPAAMSEARARQVQSWMADAMHGGLSQRGFVSQRELKQVMGSKHGCSAAEVQDVLFALEQRKDIMTEGDDIFMCS